MKDWVTLKDGGSSSSILIILRIIKKVFLRKVSPIIFLIQALVPEGIWGPMAFGWGVTWDWWGGWEGPGPNIAEFTRMYVCKCHKDLLTEQWSSEQWREEGVGKQWIKAIFGTIYCNIHRDPGSMPGTSYILFHLFLLTTLWGWSHCVFPFC